MSGLDDVCVSEVGEWWSRKWEEVLQRHWRRECGLVQEPQVGSAWLEPCMRSERAQKREAKARSLRVSCIEPVGFSSNAVDLSLGRLSLKTHLVISGDKFHCQNPERSSTDV